MAEAKLTLRRRVADAARLAWARKIVADMGDRIPNRLQVYAREQLFLAAEPERELKLQAVRIGGLGIAAIPNEVYAITGLKLKAQSPLRPTFNIGLANGRKATSRHRSSTGSADTPRGPRAPPASEPKPSRASWRQCWACWKKSPVRSVAMLTRRAVRAGGARRQTTRLLAHE